MYNFCELITMHVVIQQNGTKHSYQVNFTRPSKCASIISIAGVIYLHLMLKLLFVKISCPSAKDAKILASQSKSSGKFPIQSSINIKAFNFSADVTICLFACLKIVKNKIRTDETIFFGSFALISNKNFTVLNAKYS